jgi:hypothetical protein
LTKSNRFRNRLERGCVGTGHVRLAIRITLEKGDF